MLVIGQRQSASSMRPKYHPRNRYPMWVVVDSETKDTVKGPTSRCVCQRYLDEHAKEA